MSANHEKGEVAMVVAGRAYTLVHNHHAIALFQAHFTNQDAAKEQVASIFLLDKYVREGSLLHQEALLWALLQRHHAAEIKTVQDASDLIDADAEACGVALRRALGYAAPDDQDIAELKEADRANPPEAQPKKKRRVNGTGASASSVRVASA